MFSPTPRGKRKVILSTNIAETSLTLEVNVHVRGAFLMFLMLYYPLTLVSFPFEYHLRGLSMLLTVGFQNNGSITRYLFPVLFLLSQIVPHFLLPPFFWVI